MELVIFSLIVAVIALNYRREVWKHRAILSQDSADSYKRLWEGEIKMADKIYQENGLKAYRNRDDSEWPETIDL